MTEYRHNKHGSIVRVADGLTIPALETNADYRALIASGAPIAPYALHASADAAKAARLRDLATRRWQATQRFVFDGVETAADSAIPVVTGSIVAMQIRLDQGDPNPTKLWKLADNAYRTFDYAGLIAFGQAIEEHIQACFVREAELAAAIAAAETIEAVEAIDIEAGWPA